MKIAIYRYTQYDAPAMADLTDAGYWDTAILRAAGRLLMLAAFKDRPGHGYDIARRLSEVCGDWCDPSPAMIYPAIRELEASGLIVCKEEIASGRQRRVCSLTPEGEEALRIGLVAWQRFLPTMADLVSQQADQGEATAADGCCAGTPTDA